MFNTIIFYIAGFKLGMLFVDFAAVDGAGFEYAWAMYPVVLLTRAVTIALLFPLLSYCGKKRGMPLSWRSAVIMWWGGLRGSVSLALSLVVFHTMYEHGVWGGAWNAADADGTLLCRDIPRDTLYITTIIVSLTVIVNGSSCGVLLRLLRLDVVPDDRKFMLNALSHKLEEETAAKLSQVRQSEFLKAVNWEMVQAHLQKPAPPLAITGSAIKAAWHEALNIERQSYMVQFERGELDPDAFSSLETILAELQACDCRAPP